MGAISPGPVCRGRGSRTGSGWHPARASAAITATRRIPAAYTPAPTAGVATMGREANGNQRRQTALRHCCARATALTLLARRVDLMTLFRISGHVDPSMILKRYYRERVEDIAARI